MKKAWVLSYPLSAQRRLWSDWADAQADLSLCWAHSHFVGFVMRRLNCRMPFTKANRWGTGKPLYPRSCHDLHRYILNYTSTCIWKYRKLQKRSKRSGPIHWQCMHLSRITNHSTLRHCSQGLFPLGLLPISSTPILTTVPFRLIPFWLLSHFVYSHFVYRPISSTRISSTWITTNQEGKICFRAKSYSKGLNCFAFYFSPQTDQSKT